MPYNVSRTESNDEKLIRRLLGKTKGDDKNHQLLISFLKKSIAGSSKSVSPGETNSCASSEVLNDADASHVFQCLNSKQGFTQGQTFNMWKASMDTTFRLRQLRKKRVLYMQQLEPFPDFLEDFTYQGQHFLSFVSNFLRLFFLGFRTDCLPQIDIKEKSYKITKRTHSVAGLPQLLVRDVQRLVHRNRPKKAFCLLGITWTDLYPCEDLNFILGEGSCNLESAVMCFGHYDSKALAAGLNVQMIEDVDGFLLWKIFKVMSHEVCHVLGLQHCTFYHCLMNESKSVAEAMAQPFLLCPVCLRKLHKVCKFDIMERYRLLHNMLTTVNEAYPYEGFANTLTKMQTLMHNYGEKDNLS